MRVGSRVVLLEPSQVQTCNVVPARSRAGEGPRQVVPFGPAQAQTCEVVPRPVPGGGSRLSLEKARTQRVAGGGPPPPLF